MSDSVGENSSESAHRNDDNSSRGESREEAFSDSGDEEWSAGAETASSTDGEADEELVVLAPPPRAPGPAPAPAPAPDVTKKILFVRKDLYPAVKLPKTIPDCTALRGDLSNVSCVKLETDFEQSIDDIASEKMLRLSNGTNEEDEEEEEEDTRPRRSRKRRSDERRSQDTNSNLLAHGSRRNGYLPPESKRRKSTPKDKRSGPDKVKKDSAVTRHIKGGKNLEMLNLKTEDEADDSDSVVVSSGRKGGKPFSHQMSQIPPRRGKPRSVAEVPKSGKPRSMMGMGSSSSKKKQSGKKVPVETYHSQISEDTNRIKLKIRKASSQSQSKQQSSQPRRAAAEAGGRRRRRAASPGSASSGEEYNPGGGGIAPIVASASASTVVVAAPVPSRQRTASHNVKASQAKASKATPAAESSGVRTEQVSSPAKSKPTVPQTAWGSRIPEEILTEIFKHVTSLEGTLPSLIRVGEVCKLWHGASTTAALWGNVELSHHTKDKWKTDHRLVWLLENRLTMCHHLNLSNWKVSNLAWVIPSLVECCPGLRELNLTGWKRLTGEQLKELTTGLEKLSRLDLSCTSETGSSGSCLSVTSLSQVTQAMADRLTHLTLANNKLTGLPMILNALAANCPRLELLDLSNLAAVSHPAIIPLERLQKGCPRLRVLRITNSQVVLGTSTTQEQMESPGFPLLEELSVACPSTDYKLVDDDALGRLLKASTSLRLLDVRGCIRITDSGLIKVPAWDLQHLFLSGCCVTRQSTSCLELICEKWSHSLLEVDLAWSTATFPLDAAIEALSEKGTDSKLRILNLCGSSVSFEPVKRILLKCPSLESVNLASCRALPRGMKRHYVGKELIDLRESLDPVKKKEKEERERIAKEAKKKAQEEAKLKQEEAKKKLEESKKSTEDKKNLSDGANDVLKGDKEEDAKEKSPDASGIMCSPVAVTSGQDFSPLAPSPRTFSPTSKNASASVHDPFSPQRSTVSTPPSNLADLGREAVSASDPVDCDSVRDPSGSSGGRPGDSLSPFTKDESLSSSQPSPDAALSARRERFSPSTLGQESPQSSHKSPPDAPQSTVSGEPTPPARGELEEFSPERSAPGAASRSGNGWNLERFGPAPGSGAMMPSPDSGRVTSSGGKPCGQWNLDRFSPMARAEASPAPVPSPETAAPAPARVWGLDHFGRRETSPGGRSGPGPSEPVSGSWNLGQFSPMPKADSSSSFLKGAVDPIVNMWGAAEVQCGRLPPAGDVPGRGKADNDRMASDALGNGDRVSTTTHCSSGEQTAFSGYRDPLLNFNPGIE